MSSHHNASRAKEAIVIVIVVLEVVEVKMLVAVSFWNKFFFNMLDS